MYCDAWQHPATLDVCLHFEVFSVCSADSALLTSVNFLLFIRVFKIEKRFVNHGDTRRQTDGRETALLL